MAHIIVDPGAGSGQNRSWHNDHGLYSMGGTIDFTSSLILGDRTIWQGKRDPNSRKTTVGNPTPKLCVQQPT